MATWPVAEQIPDPSGSEWSAISHEDPLLDPWSDFSHHKQSQTTGGIKTGLPELWKESVKVSRSHRCFHELPPAFYLATEGRQEGQGLLQAEWSPDPICHQKYVREDSQVRAVQFCEVKEKRWVWETDTEWTVPQTPALWTLLLELKSPQCAASSLKGPKGMEVLCRMARIQV